MNYIVFDLEFNNLQDIENTKDFINDDVVCERIKECPNEIIEIGAVKVDKQLNIIDEFKAFVKPTIYKKMNPSISSFTGITDSMVKNGMDFQRAIEEFKNFVDEDSILCSWAKDDIVEVVRNSNYHSMKDLTWIKQYVDVQEYCTKVLAEKTSLGLKNALNKLNIKYDEEKLHDGLNDALYTVDILKRIFNGRIIKNYIITDIQSLPAITVTDLENFVMDEDKIDYRCPKCGGEIEEDIPLSIVNWRFLGLAVCKKCRNRVLQQIVIKKNLEGKAFYKNNNRILSENEYITYVNRLQNIV